MRRNIVIGLVKGNRAIMFLGALVIALSIVNISLQFSYSVIQMFLS